MSVYKPCDIRGPVTELSPELYRLWGAALLVQSLPYLAALAMGLISAFPAKKPNAHSVQAQPVTAAE